MARKGTGAGWAWRLPAHVEEEAQALEKQFLEEVVKRTLAGEAGKPKARMAPKRV